jgi:hypothetical protein
MVLCLHRVAIFRICAAAAAEAACLRHFTPLSSHARNTCSVGCWTICRKGLKGTKCSGTRSEDNLTRRANGVPIRTKNGAAIRRTLSGDGHGPMPRGIVNGCAKNLHLAQCKGPFVRLVTPQADEEILAVHRREALYPCFKGINH